MLREIQGMTAEPSGEPRRWFHDDYFDLFIRQSPTGEIIAMDLCYGIGAAEHALAWRKGLGFFLDGPEEGVFDVERLSARFARECGEVPHGISTFVLRALREFAQLDPPLRTRRQQFRRERWQRETGPGAR